MKSLSSRLVIALLVVGGGWYVGFKLRHIEQVQIAAVAVPQECAALISYKFGDALGIVKTVLNRLPGRGIA